jgi:hypothetical protein
MTLFEHPLRKENFMKRFTCISWLLVAGILALGVFPVLASDCPNMHKALMAYYDKTAKVQGVDKAKLEQAKKMLDDSIKAHEGGKHKDSMKQMADAMDLLNASRP